MYHSRDHANRCPKSQVSGRGGPRFVCNATSNISPSRTRRTKTSRNSRDQYRKVTGTARNATTSLMDKNRGFRYNSSRGTLCNGDRSVQVNYMRTGRGIPTRCGGAKWRTTRCRKGGRTRAMCFFTPLGVPNAMVLTHGDCNDLNGYICRGVHGGFGIRYDYESYSDI